MGEKWLPVEKKESVSENFSYLVSLCRGATSGGMGASSPGDTWGGVDKFEFCTILLPPPTCTVPSLVAYYNNLYFFFKSSS